MMKNYFFIVFCDDVLQQLTGSRHIFKNNMAIDSSLNHVEAEFFEEKKVSLDQLKVCNEKFS